MLQGKQFGEINEWDSPDETVNDFNAECVDRNEIQTLESIRFIIPGMWKLYMEIGTWMEKDKATFATDIPEMYNAIEPPISVRTLVEYNGRAHLANLNHRFPYGGCKNNRVRVRFQTSDIMKSYPTKYKTGFHSENGILFTYLFWEKMLKCDFFVFHV